jgi:hypothetical protein
MKFRVHDTVAGDTVPGAPRPKPLHQVLREMARTSPPELAEDARPNHVQVRVERWLAGYRAAHPDYRLPPYGPGSHRLSKQYIKDTASDPDQGKPETAERVLRKLLKE